ncbi:hypothetical protein NL50_03555 [Clostridium acetobutylicum]|nr:hypothetical protein NL50_03555 [Clostridium acetobutylicum]
MYIGCNWSKALKFLLEKDEVKIDYIKAGAYGDFENEFSTMRSMKPILIHGLGKFERTGMKDINLVDFYRANSIIKRCSSPHFGIHLEIKNSDMYEGMKDENIYEYMCKQIQTFKKNIEVPLLLENVPDSPIEHTVFDCYPYFQPKKLTKLFLDNNVDFLLDLTHAKITSKYHKIDVHEYLNGLPLERVREIHVNGSGYDEEGFPMDTHSSMEKEDYDLLRWVLTYSKPYVVTLEYAGTKKEKEADIIASLKTQLREIQNIIISR